MTAQLGIPQGTAYGQPGELPASYRPDDTVRTGLFLVLEGISGSGKSTIAALLAARLGCPSFHTVPAPVADLQPCINAAARALPQLAFYLAGQDRLSQEAGRHDSGQRNENRRRMHQPQLQHPPASRSGSGRHHRHRSDHGDGDPDRGYAHRCRLIALGEDGTRVDKVRDALDQSVEGDSRQPFELR
ncbi:MAG: hypothetical protein M3Y33_16310 [Actinomycetota bacterium]|nr:hypothetical protein [Actinomycetota bacterium]